MKRILCLILICILLCGCSKDYPHFNLNIICMDTTIRARLWGPHCTSAANEIADCLKSLEEQWDAGSDTSLIAALNNGTAQLDSEQQALIDRIEALSVRTGGAFDPRLYAVSEAWGFPTDDFRRPTQQELKAAMTQKKWDLGAALKGYAGEKCVELLEQTEISHAMVNLGGNVQTYGNKPDGSPWNIGIQSPNGEGMVGILHCTGTTSVVTSGDYQRFFELDGERYYHILDPKTGCPADSGLSSVTVICNDGLTADVLSTALFVMGLEEGTRFWQESDDFEAVFILTTGEIYATEGANLHDCQYEVISREN